MQWEEIDLIKLLIRLISGEKIKNAQCWVYFNYKPRSISILLSREQQNPVQINQEMEFALDFFRVKTSNEPETSMKLQHFFSSCFLIAAVCSQPQNLKPIVMDGGTKTTFYYSWACVCVWLLPPLSPLLISAKKYLVLPTQLPALFPIAPPSWYITEPFLDDPFCHCLPPLLSSTR